MGVVLQILGRIITFTVATEVLRRSGIGTGWRNPRAFFRHRAWGGKVLTLPRNPPQTLRSLAPGAAQIVPPASVQQRELLQAMDACCTAGRDAARPSAV